MSNNQNKWSRTIFFSLATIGAAVGLGNLWRFPSIAYQNGGGSFFIPFVVCYLLVGLPLILLEFGMGGWSKGSVAESFKKINKRYTWMGWWVLVNSFVIVAYYTIIMGWCLQYAIYSLKTEWGSDTSSFFFNDVLHITSAPNEIGGLNVFTVVCLLCIWLITYFVLSRGIKTLSKVLLITVPIPFILVVVLAIRSISMPGGVEGLEYFLKPNLSKIVSIDVWTAAAGQVILSLSLGMGQMVAYSSMKKEGSSSLKPAFSLIAGDFMFSLFAGIAVFATFGAMQFNLGLPMEVTEEAAKGLSGPALAFVTYPAAISALPYAPLFGFLFFFMLFLLGIDSVFAVVEANVTDLKTAFPKLSKNKVIGGFCILSFIGGVFFAFGNGMYLLDVVDHWVGNFAIFSIIILQCIVFGTSSKLKEIATSIGSWLTGFTYKSWRLWFTVILPIVFTIFLFSQLYNEFIKPYSDYPWLFVLVFGWGIFLLAIVVGVLIAKKHNSVSNQD
jgi:neurotransmitter:Na+ symporter, NSS family